MSRKEKANISGILLLFALLASLPLLRNTLLSAPVLTHDTFFHTQRIWSLKNALLEGQFPVRIYTEIYNGYGYGAPLYYPDILLYIPAVLCILGVPLATSYNIFMILANVATVGIAYYSYSYIIKSKIMGVIATGLYTLSTYRLLDMYTRGAVGELLALVFAPLVLCGLIMLKRGDYHKWWVVALAYTGVVQSHILSFVMLAGMGVLYAVFHWKRFLNGKAILSVVKAGGLWLLLNAWFLLPFLKAMKELPVWGNPSFWKTGASPVQLFDLFLPSVIGTEVFGGDITKSIPKTPGVLLLIGLSMLLVALVVHRNQLKEVKWRILGYTLPGILAVLMVTNLFPWGIVQKIPGLRGLFPKFQFMWRFNVLAILFLSIAAAYGFYYLFVAGAAHKQRWLVVISGVTIAFGLIYISQFMKQASEFTNEEVVQYGYMDMLYLRPGFSYLTEGQIESNEKNIQYSAYVHEKGRVSCQIDSVTPVSKEQDIYIDVPLTYYTGYQARLDGQPVAVTYSEKGVVRVYLPEGCPGGKLEVFYEDGLVVKLANVMSLLTWMGFLAVRIIPGIRKRITKEAQT